MTYIGLVVKYNEPTRCVTTTTALTTSTERAAHMAERQNNIDRFMKFVSPEPNSGCWLWTGAVFRYGHGSIWFPPFGCTMAHRVSYMLFKGPIPGGLSVCHACDVPCCVNPDHLWLGAMKDNMQDARAKKRLFGMRLTHCKRGHEFTPDNLAKGHPSRYCLACMRLRYARNKDTINASRRAKLREAGGDALPVDALEGK